MTWIKVCGITCIEDAINTINLGANALGFVFAESPRKITIEKAKSIIIRLPEGIDRVGVFVNEKFNTVKKIAKNCNLNMIQFHGNESPEYCLKFSQYGHKVIKAFHIKNKNLLK